MDLRTYLTLDATEMATMLKTKEVTPKELLSLSFEQLEKVNPTLNAVISDRRERVLKEAENVDVTANTFSGVPFLLKNVSQSLKGEPMTSGSRLLQANIAGRNSNYVDQLEKAGFLFLGHTNVPEFALKNITEPEQYGPSRNPWNPEYSPGGSSGGAAAAIASGVVPVAGASDGGGSIRIPASFSGIFGLKPTRGRTPVGPGVGRQWQGASIDFALSRTVRDSAALLDILQVVQPEAAFQVPLFQGSFVQEMKKSFDKPLKIAFTTESPVGTPVSEDAKKAVRQVVAWLEAQGHHVEEKDNGVDGIQLMRNYFLMNSGEMSSVILELEAAFGRTMTADDMEIESWLLNIAGRQVTAAEFTKSLAAWDTAAEQMARLHRDYDFYITPATAHPAPKIGELTHSDATQQELRERVETLDKDGQQELIYEMFLPSLTYTPFTQLANLTGQPAVSLPVHVTEQGLPLGVQVIASKGEEHRLLQLSYQIEQSDLWVDVNRNPYFREVLGE